MSTHSYSRLWTHLIIANQEEHHRSGLIRKSMRCLLSGMAWNGEPRKTIKMVTPSILVPLKPQPKGWENESLSELSHGLLKPK
jgi:hypothetical protein